MPRATWQHHRDRPHIEVAFRLPTNNQQVFRKLIADTGAGTHFSNFDLILDNADCLLFGGASTVDVRLGGAFRGIFPLYSIRGEIPQLGFDHELRVVGVPSVPIGFTGLACFCFLNRFTYGNFGDAAQFGLEV